MKRGLRIVRGYVQIRIMHKGQYYHKNFGADSVLARQLADIHLSEKRKEILMGRFGVVAELPVKSFGEAARLYFARWSNEKDAEGRIRHGAAREAGRIITSNLVPYFGTRSFESIRPVDIQRWREKRLKSVLGTSVNREQAVLSSIFSHTAQWVANGDIPAFKLPIDPQSGNVFNPCTSVEKAPNRKRRRVLSILELKALKAACYELKDEDMWEICGMALKSLLRKKDLFNLEAGIGIETVQAKTQRGISLPVGVLRPLQYKNFRRRWDCARHAARLEDCQFRDLRKTGANLLKMKKHSQKMISEFLGHASTRTTEIYMIDNAEHLKPLAKDLADILDGL